DGGLVASGSYDGTIRVWAVPFTVLGSEPNSANALPSAQEPLLTLAGHAGGVWSVAQSADGRLLASGTVDGTIQLWAVPSGELLASWRGHTGGVWGLAVRPDGQVIVSGGEDRTIRLWSVPADGVREGRLLGSLEGHTGAVRGVALSGDAGLLASASWDSTVRLWEPASERPLAVLEGH